MDLPPQHEAKSLEQTEERPMSDRRQGLWVGHPTAKGRGPVAVYDTGRRWRARVGVEVDGVCRDAGRAGDNGAMKLLLVVVEKRLGSAARLQE